MILNGCNYIDMSHILFLSVNIWRKHYIFTRSKNKLSSPANQKIWLFLCIDYSNEIFEVILDDNKNYIGMFVIRSFVKSMPVFNNLVNLSIESNKDQGWQVMPLLLKSCPNLQTLVIKVLSVSLMRLFFCWHLTLYILNWSLVSGSCAQSNKYMWWCMRLHT